MPLRGYPEGMEPTLILAHAGHWILEATMFAPAIVLVLFVTVRSILQRRNEPRINEEIT